MKVLVTARSFGSADNRAQKLLEENGFQVKKLMETDGPISEQLRAEIVDADAVIAGLDDYTQELLATTKNLKVISRYGVGYDKVDLKAAKERDIAVTITPGANGDSVADMAVALMLAVARNISLMDSSIKEGSQQRPTGIEIFGKTLGVVGAGRIGKSVAKRCKGFSMDILCYDKYQDDDFAKETGVKYVDFETIVKESDFITIHSPLNDETKNMFNHDTFKKMKNNAIIVNTARGGIIDEDALSEALENRIIGGAGLDATLEEPPYNSPLLGMSNCTITPHAGAATYESSSKMGLMAAQNILDIFQKGKCDFAVN